MLITCLALLFVIVWFEAIFWFAFLALVWALPVFAGVAAAHFVQSLHLDDPLAPLWAFFVAALIGRLLVGQVLSWLRRQRAPPTVINHYRTVLRDDCSACVECDFVGECAVCPYDGAARIRELQHRLAKGEQS